MNDTLYTGALNSLAKQLRSQYPGYRDYIDEQIQSVSGMNPANAFMKNLLEDINRNSESNKTETNAIRSSLQGLIDKGFHDAGGTSAATVMQAWKSGLIDGNKVNSWINSSMKLDFDIKQRAANRADTQGNEADAAVSATKELSQNAAQTIAQNWSTMTIAKGTDTPAGLSKFLQENAGNSQVMDERSQAIGQQMQAMRTRTFQMLMAKANEGGTNSLVSRLGGDPEKAAKVINGQLATWDLAIQDVYNKDWGSAYSHMNFNKAIAADSTNVLYNAKDDDVRKYNRMVGAINNISPQFGKDFFQRSLLSNVPQGEKEFLKTIKMELLTQPDAPMGKLTSLQGVIDNAKAKGMQSPKSWSDLIHTIDNISDPKLATEQKLNLAKGFFDPSFNGEILSDKNFQKDRYDPTLKREIPGKYAFWMNLTSDNVAQGVSALGKTDPSIITKYRDTMSRNFGEQLFSRELRELGDTNRDFTPSSLYKIKFTNDKGSTPHFEVVGPQGEPMSMTKAIALRAPIQPLNRLNESMAGLYNVFQKTGSQDPVNDVMKTIYRYNYQDASNVNNSPGREESLTGTAKAIWNALISAQQDRLRKATEGMR
jgi:hypothetical protein